MAEILLKVSNVFRGENLALFTVTAFTASENVQKNWMKSKLDEIQNGRQHKIQG